MSSKNRKKNRKNNDTTSTYFRSNTNYSDKTNDDSRTQVNAAVEYEEDKEESIVIDEPVDDFKDHDVVDSSELNEVPESGKVQKKYEKTEKVKMPSPKKIKTDVKKDFDWTPVKKSGIFIGIVVVFLGVLIGFALLSNNSYKSGLRTSLSKALNEKEFTYQVNEYVPLKSVYNSSCGVFSVNDLSAPKKNGSLYGIIVRVTTMYGPLPAVFLYDAVTNQVTFVNYIDIRGNTLNQIINVTKNSQLQYWEKRIPEMMHNATDIFGGE